MRQTAIAILTIIAAAVPVPAATIYATNTTGSLLRFDSASPGITTSVSITGLQSNETLTGIDFRPVNGLLYGLGSTGRLYIIDPGTGAATQVGVPGAFTLSGSTTGFDFNPVPDRIRIVNDADQNLRVNPADATLTATDTTLAYAAGDVNAGRNPRIAGAAYTNSFAGAATTTLYGIDSSRSVLVTQNPPNAGVLNTVGSLGLNFTDDVGFDILADGNVAYAALRSTGFSSLYTINLNTGAASLVGAIGTNQVVTTLAVAPIPEPGTVALVALGLAALLIRRRR